MHGIVLLSLISGIYSTFTCIGQTGMPVDWWMIYKMPIVKDGSVPGVEQGLGFYYMDARSAGKWTASKKLLNETGHAISNTLKWFYDRQTDPWVFHVMYNDAPYTGENGSEASESTKFGHTKGVVVFDQVSGFWYVHSVPQFPPPDKYAYPASGQDYGQSMLCMTFMYSELAKIGTQLYYNRPNIYSSFLPTEMAAANPDLVKAINAEYSTSPSSVVDLTTRDKVIFKSFAKSKYFNQDLYDGLVAPTLQTGLTVESWRRGGLITLQCSLTYVTNDALSMKVGNTTEFAYTKDHSKMARSTSDTKPYLCIGDINRMTSQYLRGGGTLCINSKPVWQAYDVIATQNSC
ncbi:hypothetical protein WR25_14549 [Diploscapter pachys]|uniref:Uncharacterized protein n=1 Tax=Diploscapter pachys TaxID=2018661 RepID=A0A2A2L4I7_9BILA|nr:hypothetical protein WR25_14549 [Diploscapter pachys]